MARVLRAFFDRVDGRLHNPAGATSENADTSKNIFNYSSGEKLYWLSQAGARHKASEDGVG